MNIHIANFGRENSYWPECLKRQTIATFNDEDLHPYWIAGDREGWIAHCFSKKQTPAGITPTKSVASRWFNLMNIVIQSNGDMWLHREKNELWWTITKPEDASINLIEPFEPNNNGTRMFVANKPCQPWSNKSKIGASLIWPGLHPHAREFLFTEGTMQKLTPEHADYAVALVAGQDLSQWHSLQHWKAKVEKSKRAPSRSLNPWERAVVRMVGTVTATVAGAQGQEVIRRAKMKELRMSSMDLETYLHALIRAQDGLCAITGLRLQTDGDQDDDELLCSLDRIDSNGHYEVGNLQVVCRFVNRWKNDSNNEEFGRLIELVRSSSVGR